MLGFPTKTIKFIKDNLVKQQKEVEKDLKEIEAEDPAKEAIPESSEPGTDSYIADTHTRIMALGDTLKKANLSIQKALAKIGKGTYGKCEKCDKQIEVGRLLAMPTAEYCLSDSSKQTKKS